MISIVIPSSRKELLKNCLYSIIDKKWKYPYEIIIVRCYTDNLDIKNNHIVDVYRHKDGGAKAYLQGINSAKGKYVTSINDDCTLINHKLLENSCMIMDKNKNIGGIHHLMKEIDPFKKYSYGTIGIGGNLEHFGVYCPNFPLFRKELIYDYDYNYYLYGIDYDIALQCLMSGLKIGWMTNFSIIHHFSHERQIPSTQNPNIDEKYSYYKWRKVTKKIRKHKLYKNKKKLIKTIGNTLHNLQTRYSYETKIEHLNNIKDFIIKHENVAPFFVGNPNKDMCLTQQLPKELCEKHVIEG